jgi:hypothetical protein
MDSLLSIALQSAYSQAIISVCQLNLHPFIPSPGKSLLYNQLDLLSQLNCRSIFEILLLNVSLISITVKRVYSLIVNDGMIFDSETIKVQGLT